MRVASQWWILLVTTVLITSVTFVFWLLWKSKTEKTIRRKMHLLEPAHLGQDLESGSPGGKSKWPRVKRLDWAWTSAWRGIFARRKGEGDGMKAM